MLLFLVLIELEATWAQKETIKWLQLRSVINSFYFFFHKAKGRINTAEVCSGRDACHTARTPFTNPCPDCCNRQGAGSILGDFSRLYAISVAAAAQCGGAGASERSMDTHGCMYSTCSSHTDSRPMCGILQIRRTIQWWSWLPLLDSEYLQENHIPRFGSTRTLAAKANQGAGVRAQLGHAPILLCKVPIAARGCYSSFWKQVNWFCWKLHKHCTNHFLKIIYMFGFASVLYYCSPLLQIQKLYCSPDGFLSWPLPWEMKRLVFNPSFCQNPSVTRRSCMSCLITTAFAVLMDCIHSSETFTIALDTSRLNHKADFHTLRCFPFCSVSFPLFTSESDSYFWCSVLFCLVTTSLYLKLNGCPLQRECNCFLVLHAFSWVIPELLILSKTQGWSY